MDFLELQRLVTHATASGRFYREHFGLPKQGAPLSIASMHDWQRLPFLTKEDLSSVPLRERSFLPLRDVDYIVTSSGTTGMLPVFNPRARQLEYEFRADFHPFQKAVLCSKLLPHQHERFLFVRDLPATMVVLDPRSVEASVVLAKAAGVDAILAFLHHIPLIAPAMVARGMGAHIRFIETAGQVFSRALLREMRAAFPNAVIVHSFGMTEVESSAFGVPCTALSEDNVDQHLHIKPGIHLELLDPVSGDVLALEENARGEMVISSYTGEPAAFPVIRLRTGDIVEIAGRCATHAQWTFVARGRARSDYIIIPGGQLKADEIERVLRLYPDRVDDDFELHVHNADAIEGPVRIVLHVHQKPTKDPQPLEKLIARELRVNPGSTLADRIASGACHFECAALQRSGDLRKPRRLHRHS